MPPLLAAEEIAHLWVLAYTPDGRYYPQTVDACSDTHVSTTESGRWQVRAQLGNENDAERVFELLAVLVDEETHLELLDYLANGCETGNYPGYLSIELPAGIDIKDTHIVTRE
ncbi:MAG: hypothetical protein GY943_29110 [Chloroflexi bacterium]|nr:hypothetical protein [Chloroflexota bacterium]